MTGQVVVHRQSEWDDESRARAIALVEYESTLCGDGCGRPLTETAKPDQSYLVHTYTCQASKAMEKVRRDDRAKRKDAPEGWDAGLHYYAEPVDTPTDQTTETKPGVKRGN